MSEAVLGLPFDIHTGGIDHREIHHPNEIAQNQARCRSADTGARMWMHNNFLIDRGGKMSKSSGEFLRLQLLVDRGFHPLAFRLMCLQAHYRSELEFSWDSLAAALTRLKRMVMAISKLREATPASDVIIDQYLTVSSRGPGQPWGEYPDDKPFNIVGLTETIENDFLRLRLDSFNHSLEDDLNIPQALVWLDQVIEAKGYEAADKLRVIAAMDLALGLNLPLLTRADLRVRPADATIAEDEIEARLAARKAARADKDFATSDRLRDELKAAGVEVMDGDPLGWEWAI
jgi:cysteinyl-tRNA synthetase